MIATIDSTSSQHFLSDTKYEIWKWYSIVYLKFKLNNNNKIPTYNMINYIGIVKINVYTY